jgi:predicted small metal-binding protein
MAFVYSCDCGYVASGETADAFVQDVQAHIEEAHPDMVGKLSEQDILALAEEH